MKMEKVIRKRSNRKFTILFVQILLVDILLEVVIYQYGGKDIFGKLWSSDGWHEKIIHSLWLTFISTPILFLIIKHQFVKQDILSTKIWRLAHYDDLTGLLNRYFFMTKLEEAFNNANPSEDRFGVLFIDLDRFKNINDICGHDIGDKVIQTVAERIRKKIRHNDVLARFAGDEFVVFLPKLTKNQEAIEMMDHILESIKEKIFIEGFELYVTSSIGLSIYPNSGMTAASLLKSADTAMYEAKKEGKNCYAIHLPSMQEIVYAKFKLENDLHKALEDPYSSKQLFVEYQPQKIIKSGKIIGAEALIRWEHPNIGLISPNEFIPIAEEAGLIYKLGDFVLKSVCMQLKEWNKQGENLVPISVNVSQMELSKSDFVQHFLDIINNFNIPYSLISIEVTETTLMKNKSDVAKKLEQLRDLGIKVLLDDFGKEYSSLGLLKHLPIDIMKIDKEFVRDIYNSPLDESILTTFVQLAHLNHFQVLAEGVELEQQLAVLKKKDCDEYQGYLLSPPVSPIEFINTFLVK